MKAWRTTEILTLGGSLAALVAGAWLLPYQFPPSDFVAGASFQVGFNNSVAYVWYLAFIVIPGLILARLLPGGMRVLPSTLPHAAVPVSRRVFVVVALAHLAVFGAIYGYKGRFVFAEALYFQTLLYRMTLGEIPYRDFSFYYGPSMLYPAHWLSGLVGLDAGYALCFVGTYVVGLFFLYSLLRVFLASDRSAAAWFIFLAVGLFNPLTGLNVTFVRYLFPSIVFLAVARLLRDGGLLRFSAAALCLAVAMTYSFEVAVLGTVATSLVLAVHLTRRQLRAGLGVLRRVVPPVGVGEVSEVTLAEEGPLPSRGMIVRRGAVLLAAAVSASLAFFYLIDPSGTALRTYSDIALSYSSGAHNMPIYPNLPFLSLVAGTVFALAAMLRMIAGHYNSVAVRLAVAYLFLALLTQRGAFGVSEPSHFAYFGLPTFFLGLLLGARFFRPGVVGQWLAIGLLVGVVFPMQYYYVTQFLPFLSRFAPSTAATRTGQAERSRLGGGNLEVTLTEVVLRVGADRPYVMYELDYYSFPVYRKLGLRYPMYYTMLINARTDEGIKRVIEEVRATRAIVVARAGDLTGWEQPPRSRGSWRLLDFLSGAHTGSSQLTAILLANKARLLAPFLEFVRNEYHPVYERDGLVALRPKDE